MRADEVCTGCHNSLSSNIDAMVNFEVSGPLGSRVSAAVTTNSPGNCEPNCVVEGVCKFAFTYELEYGAHGIASGRTDAVRTTSGTTYFTQGIEHPTPGPGAEVTESVGPVDVACGHQVLYFFAIWFDQPVGTGTPADPTVWSSGPIAFTCSTCKL